MAIPEAVGIADPMRADLGIVDERAQILSEKALGAGAACGGEHSSEFPCGSGGKRAILAHPLRRVKPLTSSVSRMRDSHARGGAARIGTSISSLAAFNKMAGQFIFGDLPSGCVQSNSLPSIVGSDLIALVQAGVSGACLDTWPGSSVGRQ